MANKTIKTNNTKNDDRKNNRSRSNKPHNSGNGKPGEQKSDYRKQADKQEEEQDYNNRPSMYFDPKDKDLIEQVTTFSCNQFLEPDGRPFHDTKFQDTEVPAFMLLYFNPSCGFTRGTSTAAGGVNIAAMKLYTKLSAMNAKTTQYAPQDLATLMLALGEIVSSYEWIKRFFRVAFAYNKRNWNLPMRLIQQMGVNADDFIKNLADYRLRFNAVVNQVNQISFPGDCEYFAKCAEMYSHIYKDSESSMAQFYIFQPATSWIIDEDDYEEGTILKTVAAAKQVNGVTGRYADMSVYINELEQKIQAILNSATYNFIYADVLRTVNPSNLLTMPYVVEGEALDAEFDPMMLLQINNALVMGMPDGALGENSTPANDVYPKVNNNAIFYSPQFPYGFLDGRAIINFPHSMGDPDVDQRIESSRMIGILDRDNETGITEDAALPDHYITTYRIDMGSIGTSIDNVSYQNPNNFTAAQLSRLVAALAKFDYAPRLYMIDTTATKVVDIIGDLDFFTEIDFEYLKKFNDLAYVHMFDLGSVAVKQQK